MTSMNILMLLVGIIFVIYAALYGVSDAMSSSAPKNKTGFFNKIMSVISAICITICTVILGCFYPFMWIIIKACEFAKVIEEKQKNYK